MKPLMILAALAALAAPTNLTAEEWWQGNWAFDPEWCAEADNIGSVTPAPIAITETEMLGYEMSCGITFAQELYSVGATHLKLECESEGSTFEEERVVMRTDETGLAVWIWFGTGDPILFQRCE